MCSSDLQQVVGETGVDVTMISQMRFAGGEVGHTTCGFRMPFRAGTLLVGEEATLTVPTPWKPSMGGEDSQLLLAPKSGEAEIITVPGINPYLAEVEAMEACVLDGAAPVVPLGRSREILRTVLAMIASARTGKVVAP